MTHILNAFLAGLSTPLNGAYKDSTILQDAMYVQKA